MADEALPEVTPADEAAMRADAPAEAVQAVEAVPATQVAAEPEKATEPAPEKAAEAEPEKRREVVPLATHLEERKEWKARFDKQEERFQQLVQRFGPKEPEVAKPTVETDPLGVVNDLQKWRAEREQKDQADNQRNQLRSFVAAHEGAFRKTAPDYDAAVNHIIASRHRELETLGVEAMHIPGIIQAEAEQIAMVSAQRGRNPAEVIYSIAQERGYRKPEPAKAAEPDAKAQVETLQRGAAAARSLGTAGGAPGETGLTLKAIADMPLDDFAKLSDKDFERAMTRGQ